MDEAAYSLRFDAVHNVLLIAMSEKLTEEIYWAAYAATKRFVAARGPCSVILDMSLVEEFKLTPAFSDTLANTPPAVPPPMKRIAVAPKPLIFGTFRVFDALRSNTAAPVDVVRALDEAYAVFGASAADFVPVEPS